MAPFGIASHHISADALVPGEVSRAFVRKLIVARKECQPELRSGALLLKCGVWIRPNPVTELVDDLVPLRRTEPAQVFEERGLLITGGERIGGVRNVDVEIDGER